MYYGHVRLRACGCIILRNVAGDALMSRKNSKMLLTTNFDPGSSAWSFERTAGSRSLYTDTRLLRESSQGVEGLRKLSEAGVHPIAPTLFTKNFLAPMAYSVYQITNQ